MRGARRASDNLAMRPMNSGWASIATVLDRATLRSLVVETNDGIIATAGVVEGFAGAGSTGTALVIAALCTMIAGGVALGGARYAEEAAERDARVAVIAEEEAQLRRSPDEEMDELTALYKAKGLSADRGPAGRLGAVGSRTRWPHTSRRSTTCHLREIRWAPVIIAAGAGIAYALGSMIPLLAVLLAPDA